MDPRLLFPLLATSASLTGCSETCNGLFPREAVQVTFADADWAPGDYVLTLSGGDITGNCALTLPADPVDVVCTGMDAVGLSADGATIEWFEVWHLESEQVTLTITRDDADWVEQTLTPDYEVTEPNGEGCGEAYNATVGAVLP